MQFTYFMPTKVIMGAGCFQKNKELLLSLGRKALIVTGHSSAKVSGALGDITGALSELNIDYMVFDRVMNNPTIACVYEGAALAKDFAAEMIISAGGGSPMDAAKVIALLACERIPPENLFSGKYGKKALPLVLLPTTAGTGSEVTPYAVLTHEKISSKASVSSPLLFPRYAFLDPKYTASLSEEVTINTAIDAMSHAIEGFLCQRATHMSDQLALNSMAEIAGCFAALERHKIGLDERAHLLYGSMLAGMVIAQTGTTAVHSLGYSLTYFKQVDHGRANGLLLGAYLRFVEKAFPERIALMLKSMGYERLSELCSLFDSLLGGKEFITEAEVVRYAEIAAKAKNLTNSLPVPTMADLQGFLRESLVIKD